MPWRGHAAKICRRCDRHVDEVGPLSARYRCQGCGEGAHLAEVRQMRDRSGPYWREWRRAMAASVGGRLLDDAPESR